MRPLSITFCNAIQRFFSFNFYVYNTASYTNKVYDVQDGKTFNLFIKCTGDSTKMEIPLFNAGSFIRALQSFPDLSSNPSNTEVVCPIRLSTEVQTIKQGAKILNTFAGRNSYHFASVKCSDNLYYGGRGIILDKDFTPLVFTSLEGHFQLEDKNFISDVFNIYLHPSVFDSQDYIKKLLVSQLLPHLSGKRTTLAIHCDTCTLAIRIHIYDIGSKFIVKPALIEDMSEESIERFLLSDMHTVLYNMTYDPAIISERMAQGNGPEDIV